MMENLIHHWTNLVSHLGPCCQRPIFVDCKMMRRPLGLTNKAWKPYYGQQKPKVHSNPYGSSRLELILKLDGAL